MLLVAVVHLLPAACLHAQDTAHVLDEVDVLSRKLPATGKSVVPVQQLKKETISNLNSLSVADAVKYFSGVLVKDYGGIGGLKTVSVRSLGANHTGVMYDGIMLSDVQGGQVDLGKISVDNIDEISLYNAQPGNNLCQPARAYAYASVLQLKTGLPAFKSPEKVKLNAGIKTGSFGLINPSATLHYKWSGKLYSSLSTEWQKIKGEYPFTLENGDSTKTLNRINSNIHALRLELDNRLIITDSNKVSIKAYYYDSERGLPGAVILYSNAFSAQRLWDKIFFLQGNWQKQTGKSHWLFSAKYNYIYNHYLDTLYPNSTGRQENVYTQKEYYLSGAYAYQVLPYMQLSYAADFIAGKMHADLHNFAYPVRYTVLNAAAARFTWPRLEVQGSLMHTTVNENVKSGAEPGNQGRLTPTVALSWQPVAALPLRIRAFYKNIFRMPTFNDLYYTNLGNTNLRPEYAKQYNLGITWQQNVKGFVQALSVTADAYYNRVTDKIVAVPRQNLFLWTMLNFGRVDIKGLDAAAQLYFAPIGKVQLFLRGSYTYQHTQDLSTPSSDSYKDELPYTPKHSGAVNAGMEYKAITINYNALFSGSRYRLGDNIAYNRLPSWSTQDVTVAYRLPAQQYGDWKISFELNNIWNTQYDIIKYYPMPGRSFRLGLNCKL